MVVAGDKLKAPNIAASSVTRPGCGSAPGPVPWTPVGFCVRAWPGATQQQPEGVRGTRMPAAALLQRRESPEERWA